MLTEINRVLNAGGVYIVISYGQPDQRLLYLDKVIILFNILAWIQLENNIKLSS